MGAKKKAAKKSKSKTKKHSAAKHVDRNHGQEVPKFAETEGVDGNVENEDCSDEETIIPVAEEEE